MGISTRCTGEMPAGWRDANTCSSRSNLSDKNLLRSWTSSIAASRPTTSCLRSPDTLQTNSMSRWKPTTTTSTTITTMSPSQELVVQLDLLHHVPPQAVSTVQTPCRHTPCHGGNLLLLPLLLLLPCHHHKNLLCSWTSFITSHHKLSPQSRHLAQ